MLARAALVALVAGAALTSCGSTSPHGCKLSASYGSRSEVQGGQSRVELVILNSGGSCHLSGFPMVQLRGPSHPVYGRVYTVPNEVSPSGRFALEHGRRAKSVLTWLPGDWPPTRTRLVVSTQSGPSAPMTLDWPFGPVLRQDGATHPGTYVGPLEPLGGG